MARSTIWPFAVGTLHIKHEPLNAVVPNQSAQAMADSSKVVMGASAAAIAVVGALWLGGFPGKEDEQIAVMDNATIPATRGSLAFK